MGVENDLNQIIVILSSNIGWYDAERAASRVYFPQDKLKPNLKWPDALDYNAISFVFILNARSQLLLLLVIFRLGYWPFVHLLLGKKSQWPLELE